MPKTKRVKAKNQKKKCTTLQQIYQPPEWAYRLLESFKDIEVPPTVAARCRYADIERSTYYRNLRDEEFCKWLHSQLQKHFSSEFHDVQQAHFKECVKGNLEAIKLWYEVAGAYLPTTKVVHEKEEYGDSVTDEQFIDIGVRMIEHNKRLEKDGG